jgi:hypothetical protein
LIRLATETRIQEWVKQGCLSHWKRPAKVMCGDFVSNSTQNKKTKQQCGPQGKQEKHTKGKIKRKSQSAILCFQSLLAKNHTVEEIRPKMLLVKMMVRVMVMVMVMMT